MELPSVTQILEALGISDYSSVPGDILENAAERGTRVHELTADWDRVGWIDPSWIFEEEKGYFEAWQLYRSDHPRKIISIEAEIVGHVNGLLVMGHPDRIYEDGSIDDIKTCVSKQRSWEIQTAMYAWITKERWIPRRVIQIMKTGKYKIHHHEDKNDLTLAAAAVAIFYFKHEDRRKKKKEDKHAKVGK